MARGGGRRGRVGDGESAVRAPSLQLNFFIYHSAFRFTGGEGKHGPDQFEKAGRVDWVTDLAEIPAKFGVKNVYGDLG